jgi:hypothetical protein
LNAFIKRHLKTVMNLWPPFLGAGIKVRRISSDWREVDVELRPHFWNRNYVGTHYGGSMFSMTDPFWMIMLIEGLGREYVVWDKASTIRFRRPGRGVIRAEFRLPEAALDEIRTALNTQPKYERTFAINIIDQERQTVCEVEKVIHVRRKESQSDMARK